MAKNSPKQDRLQEDADNPLALAFQKLREGLGQGGRRALPRHREARRDALGGAGGRP